MKMIDEIILCIVLFATLAFIVWRQRVFDQRERDLIDRLMSRDAIEYANVKRLTRRSAPVTVADAVDKLTQEGIDAEEVFGAVGGESASDRVRVA